MIAPTVRPIPIRSHPRPSGGINVLRCERLFSQPDEGSMIMELIVLGSAGWIPSAGRETSCYAVRQGRSMLLLDAGTGVGRLAGSAEPLLHGVDELHILLSHFHLDHIIGLTYLTALRVPSKVTVWGPGSHYQATTRQLLDHITEPPYQPAYLSRLHDLRDMPADGLAVRDFDVKVRLQRLHSAPSIAMCVNGKLTYCTDTAYDEGNIEFARQTNMLIHEAWPDSSGPAAGHTTPVEAAYLARRADVSSLLLCHVPPRAVVRNLLREARAAFSNVSVAREDLRVTLQ